MKKAPCIQPIVLVLEDDEAIATMYCHMLNALGITTVAIAKNLAEAKENVQKIKFDLILSDHNLPDGKSIDFLNRMKKRHPETYRCLITSDFNLTEGHKLEHNFKAKPLKLSEMEGMVETAKKHVEEHAMARNFRPRSA